MTELTKIRAALEMLSEQVALLQKQLTTAQEQICRKDQRIEELTQMLHNLQRSHFGQRSEKSIYVLDDGTRQMSIFDTEGSSPAAQDIPDISGTVSEADGRSLEPGHHGKLDGPAFRDVLQAALGTAERTASRAGCYTCG